MRINIVIILMSIIYSANPVSLGMFYVVEEFEEGPIPNNQLDILHPYIDGILLSEENGLYIENWIQAPPFLPNFFQVYLYGHYNTEAYDLLISGGQLSFTLEHHEYPEYEMEGYTTDSLIVWNGGDMQEFGDIQIIFDIPPITGDINADLAVNIQDIILYVNILLCEVVATEEQLSVMDLNDDGNWSVLDVVVLVSIILNED